VLVHIIIATTEREERLADIIILFILSEVCSPVDGWHKRHKNDRKSCSTSVKRAVINGNPSNVRLLLFQKNIHVFLNII